MPKILSYTPSWLTRPSPGHALFSQKPKDIGADANGEKQGSQDSRIRRTIAHRGTEIFVIVDNEIRWSDLVMLRERCEEDEQYAQISDIAESQRADGIYRVLRVPISGEIKQLSISPAEDYMAIATSHTIHVAVLPNSSHLSGSSSNSSPIRPKTFQLGPTAHVLERGVVASLIWHPLGHQGRTLVTVTEDAVVRLWDVNKDDRWSFAEPALAIDLRKLASSPSIAAPSEVAPREYGDSITFSPDYVEMEVAAACFGGGSRDTNVYGDDGAEDCGDGWAPMTLYIAMKAGDVYALCPLLPARWQATASLLQSIGANVAVQVTDAEDGDDEILASPGPNREQQSLWLKEILSQEPVIEKTQIALEPSEIYRRPSRPGIVPALQGPFVFHPEMEEFADVTDLVVLEPSSTVDDADDMWDTFVEGSYGSSMGVMAIATNDGKVYTCLQLDNVEGRWVPQSENELSEEEESPPRLLTVEAIQLHSKGSERQRCYSMFTKDISSHYSFFVANEGGLYSISIASWARALEREVKDTGVAGADFRIDLLLRGMKSDVQALVQMSQAQLGRASNRISACTVLEDSDLGHFMLAEVNGQPFAVTLANIDGGERETNLAVDLDLSLTGPMVGADGVGSRIGDFARSGSTIDDFGETTADGTMIEFRPKYQPPEIFWQRSALRSTVEAHLQNRQHRKREQLLSDEVRLSVATLELMTEAHRTLSTETHQLGIAVADLFRRCERLRDEFAEQIGRVDELATRIEGVVGYDVEDDDDVDSDNAVEGRGEGEAGEAGERRAKSTTRIEQRMEHARLRQAELTARHREIRGRLSKLGAPPLTKAEESWASEVQELRQTIAEGGKGGRGSRNSDDVDESAADEPESKSFSSSTMSRSRPAEKTRLDEIKKVAGELVQQAKEAAEAEAEAEAEAAAKADGEEERGGRGGRRREGSVGVELNEDDREGFGLVRGMGMGVGMGVGVGRLGSSGLNGSGMGSRRGSGTGSGSERASRRGSRQPVSVPEEMRRAKVGEVMEMLERESALVEATAERLHRLSVQAT